MNMGALFSLAVEQLHSGYNEVLRQDYGFCWRCTLHNSYKSFTHPEWPVESWYLEVAESL